MPLSGDQRALLQLICERGQSYADIAGLLEVGVDEVRRRARAALTELGGADPDAEVGLTDYLLGQADPIGRADAVRHLQADAGARELAERIQAALAGIAPAAEQPTLPDARGKRRRGALPNAAELRRAKRGREESAAREAVAGGEPSGTRPPSPGAGAGAAAGGRDRRQTRLIAGLVAGGVVLLFVILAVAGVFSGGGSDGTTTTGADAADQSMITTVKLAPQGGSGVAGTAEFGLVGDQQLYVDLDVQGLDPKPPADNAYLLWLMVGDQAGYPISEPLQPNQNGAFSGRLSVPSAVALTVGGQADSVVVSASPIQDLRKQIRAATKEQAPILAFTGERLAAGKIPLAPGAGRGGKGSRGQGGGAQRGSGGGAQGDSGGAQGGSGGG